MKKYRGLIIGFIAGVLFATATGAYAAVGDQVQAVFAEFNLVINGQSKQLETTPLVYNGTSYLPVRELSNLVGFDVTYKADSRTIELNKSNVTGSTYGDNPVVTPPSSSGTVGSNNGGVTTGMVTSDGIEIISQNGIDYVTVHDVGMKYFDKLYDFHFDLSKNEIYLIRFPDKSRPTDQYETLSQAIPFTIINGSTCISVDTYNNVVLPLIK